MTHNQIQKTIDGFKDSDQFRQGLSSRLRRNNTRIDEIEIQIDKLETERQILLDESQYWQTISAK